jgi:hypothetical protein
VQAAAAIRLLEGLPTVNIELWAKLARAAAGQQLWGPALRAARGALAAAPEGAAPGAAPGLAAADWFWLAAAHSTAGQVRACAPPGPRRPATAARRPALSPAPSAGPCCCRAASTPQRWARRRRALPPLPRLPLQAAAAMVRPSVQGPATQLRLGRQAADHWAAAVGCAAHLCRPDLAQAAAAGLWSACLPFLGHPTTRCLAAAPLGQAAAALLTLRLPDEALQVRWGGGRGEEGRHGAPAPVGS